MFHRHAISDADWDRIKDLLPGGPGQTGWQAKDNRLFIDAVLWISKTGAPWRDLPARFGLWNSVWKRFDRWSRKGTWRFVFETLQDPDLEWVQPAHDEKRQHHAQAGAQHHHFKRHRHKGRPRVPRPTADVERPIPRRHPELEQYRYTDT